MMSITFTEERKRRKKRKDRKKKKERKKEERERKEGRKKKRKKRRKAIQLTHRSQNCFLLSIFVPSFFSFFLPLLSFSLQPECSLKDGFFLREEEEERKRRFHHQVSVETFQSDFIKFLEKNLFSSFFLYDIVHSCVIV